MSTSAARAVVLTGPRQVEVRDVEVPSPGPGQVQIATLFSGISAGTEMNVYRGSAPQWSLHRDPETKLFAPTDEPDWTYPMIYGYQNVGAVVALGEGVASRAVGDVVFSYTAHQSVVVADADSTVVVPSGIDPRLAVLNSNLNTALGGVLDARPSIGDAVVVSGLGVIGLLVAQLMRRAGAGLVIGVDRLESRRTLAKQLGADAVIEA